MYYQYYQYIWFKGITDGVYYIYINLEILP